MKNTIKSTTSTKKTTAKKSARTKPTNAAVQAFNGEINVLVCAGKKSEAIKAYRDFWKCELEEAKQSIGGKIAGIRERAKATAASLPPMTTEQFDRVGEIVREVLAAHPNAGPRATVEEVERRFANVTDRAKVNGVLTVAEIEANAAQEVEGTAHESAARIAKDLRDDDADLVRAIGLLSAEIAPGLDIDRDALEDVRHVLIEMHRTLQCTVIPYLADVDAYEAKAARS